jgi:hypothetical protein
MLAEQDGQSDGLLGRTTALHSVCALSDEKTSPIHVSEQQAPAGKLTYRSRSRFCTVRSSAAAVAAQHFAAPSSATDALTSWQGDACARITW